ncbi:glycosyltransferase [bacterium]|nr:glycosyltransferase [bacterium]
MNTSPFVSIIVRTYNRPERLKECLQCLARQKYPSLEVVIVNDAGEDVEQLLPLELGDRPYQYIQNKQNMGRTAALNIGIEAAKGEYVAFLDDDDAVYDHHIATLVDTAMPNRLPVVYSDVLNVTFQKNPNTGEWIRVKEQLVYSFDFERDNFLLANYIPINCLLIRKDCFDAVGPFDESLLIYEDWEFLVRLSRQFDFKHVRAVTGEYRRRDDNSNIKEQDAYPVNEQAVKRRYRLDRHKVFDPIFKRTFELKREIRNRDAKLAQLNQQAMHFQHQLIEANRRMAQMQQEIQQLRAEKHS